MNERKQLTVHSLTKVAGYIQIVAAIGLSISCFLPFYQSAVGKIRYVDEWGLFFWAIPVSLLIFKVSVRWLKVALCALSIIGGLLDLFLLTVLATFKSTPLIGFDIAKTSIIILVISWLALCVTSLSSARRKQAEN
jgi:hypothetical protein